MPTNEEKKTTSDAAPKGPKVAEVTWFAVHEALMNPCLNTHITSYMKGNVNMNGSRKFEWIVGAPYITTQGNNGETVIVPIVNLKSFSVKF